MQNGSGQLQEMPARADELSVGWLSAVNGLAAAGDAHVMNRQWAMRLLRLGFAVAIVSQAAFIAENNTYLAPATALRALRMGS